MVGSSYTVQSRTGTQHLSKRVNSIFQRRLQLSRKIARIGSGSWSWTSSLPEGGCLIRFCSERKVHIVNSPSPILPQLTASTKNGQSVLSRVAQLDQRTALPDQCLHSAEADVRPPRRKSGFGRWVQLVAATHSRELVSAGVCRARSFWAFR